MLVTFQHCPADDPPSVPVDSRARVCHPDFIPSDGHIAQARAYVHTKSPGQSQLSLRLKTASQLLQKKSSICLCGIYAN